MSSLPRRPLAYITISVPVFCGENGKVGCTQYILCKSQKLCAEISGSFFPHKSVIGMATKVFAWIMLWKYLKGNSWLGLAVWLASRPVSRMRGQQRQGSCFHGYGNVTKEQTKTYKAYWGLDQELVCHHYCLILLAKGC
jgi:hypothetical protein